MDDTTLDQSYVPGLTSHTATLAEYHAVTTMFGADVPASVIGQHYQATIDAQRAIAERWASAHGLEISAVSEHETLDDGRVAITTTWVVQVGRGDIDGDQSEPGALDRWRWSARVSFWRRLTQGLGREGRRLAVREDGLASVTPLRRGFGLRAADNLPPTPQMPHPDLAQPTTDPGEQCNQSGYLPGTGPVEHRPAWLRSDNLAGEVGGDWSDT
jgi:hypothetical protein